MVESEFESLYGSFSCLPEALTGEANRFAPQEGTHLYHFSNSYYSQAPRQLLEEGGVAWVSHPIDILEKEQYNPSYVQLNPWCVVPTLVRDGKVTTNCDNILDHFSKDLAPHLIPEDAKEKASMDRWLHDLRSLHIEELTYGTVPGFPKPWWFQLLGFQCNHDSEKDELAKLMAKHENDPDPFLLHAYRSRLQLVTQRQKDFTSEEFMREAISSIVTFLEKLEEQLEHGPASEGGFLCSQHYSLIDLYCGIFFNRLIQLDMGHGKLWTDEEPAICQYIKNIHQRPSYKKAIEQWNFSIDKFIVPTLFRRVQRGLGFNVKI